jgi:hypothetical protein
VKTILLPTAVGACVMGLLGSFVTYAPGYEVAGQLLFIVAGAAAGFVSGTVSYLVARRSGGRPK